MVTHSGATTGLCGQWGWGWGVCWLTQPNTGGEAFGVHMSSSLTSNMEFYHDSEQEKGLQSLDGSGPLLDIIIASSAHSTFCSEARHRTWLEYISTWDEREPPRSLGINLGLKAQPVLTSYGTSSLIHGCVCVWSTGFLPLMSCPILKEDPFHRTASPMSNIIQHKRQGQVASRVSSGWWTGLGS